MSKKLSMRHRCLYCHKERDEKVYAIEFEEGVAPFHIHCFLIANPDMASDVDIFLKDRLDNPEEK